MVLFLLQILSSFTERGWRGFRRILLKNKIKQERKSRPCGVYCGPWTS